MIRNHQVVGSTPIPGSTKSLAKYCWNSIVEGSMSNDSAETYLKLVNSSGFPLQVGIKYAVERLSHEWHRKSIPKWGVLAEEHPWENKLSGESGFIDLVLENERKPHVLVTECKRVRDTHWIFLVDSDDAEVSERAKSWITFPSKQFFGWLDLSVVPMTYESKYCVVPGQDAKAKPMLERIASSVVQATEAFAREERHCVSLGDLRMYFSVIITTANLKICRYNPDEIGLENGELEKCTFEDVNEVRFRKSLTTQESPFYGEISEVIQRKERTVFVVNASHFSDFLRKWNRIADLPKILTE
jgi:hypothetical protein